MTPPNTPNPRQSDSRSGSKADTTVPEETSQGLTRDVEVPQTCPAKVRGRALGHIQRAVLTEMADDDTAFGVAKKVGRPYEQIRVTLHRLKELGLVECDDLGEPFLWRRSRP